MIFSIRKWLGGATHYGMPRSYKKKYWQGIKKSDPRCLNLKGVLTEADDQGITLRMKSREPKPNRQGQKVTVTEKTS